MRLFITTLLALTILIAGPDFASAQEGRTMIRVTAAAPYELEKIGLTAEINGQKARCTLKYVIYNPGNSPIEVDFLAPLPTEGTVTGLVLFDGQKEMPGNVYNKDEAFKIYSEIVASLRDPALLEYAGRGLFRARIFPVPPKGRQTLELNFDYLVEKNDDQIGFSFPLAGPLTAGRTPEQDIHLVIKNVAGLSGIYSPEDGAVVKHESGRDAVVTFNRKAPVQNRFRLYFSTAPSELGGVVLSHKPNQNEDGFFLFMADPVLSAQSSAKASKNVIFVLDKSGSMNGPKFEQARKALRFILERLNPEDNFNLIDYNSRVYSWQPELMNMNPENRSLALSYVDNLRSGGSTNIESALTTSLDMMTKSSQSGYVIFMTDGQPTEGEGNEMKLAEIAKKANRNNAARLFSFGVGFDVNARLLDRLSGQAGGSTVFVDPDEDLEASVSSFFSRFTTPALTKPSLNGTLPVNRVLPETLPDLFSGQQMVVVGRYPKGGETTFTLSGQQGEKTATYTYKVNLADGPSSDGQFIAAFWAQRRIGELIDQIDMAGGKPSQELVDELVQLSKEYGILTPYTSFLALEDQAITNRDELVPLAADNLSIMSESVGASANAQRDFKNRAIDFSGYYRNHPSLAEAEQQLSKTASMDKQVNRARAAATPAPSDATGNLSPQRPSAPKVNAPMQLAGQTFFYKKGQWQAADLSDDDLKSPTVIQQFSEEYFTLAGQLGAEEMVWLSQKESVIFKFKGTTYLVEPAGDNSPKG